MDEFLLANAELSKFSRKYMQLKNNLPIRPSEMGVLNIITEIPGPHTSVLLSEMMGVSKPMIAAHLAVLLKKGYIIKQPSSDDKRSFYILPTEKAVELVARAKEDRNRQLGYLMNSMGREGFQTLIQLTAQANRALEEFSKEEEIDNGHE